MRTFSLVVLTGVAVGATLPSGGSADNAGAPERQAQVSTGARSAADELVTIEQRLVQTRAELSSFRSRAARVQARRRAVTQELAVTRSAVRGIQHALAMRLQGLYEQGDEDTLAVILGAGSLGDALDAIEAADLAATQDESLIEKARAASARLVRLQRALAARQRELEQLAAARLAAAASLADARSERIRTIASLRANTRSNVAAIAGYTRHARGLAARSEPAAPVPASTAAVQSLTVLATGYALRGRTASGRPVGWGAVAVDPSVIPLGSRLGIPGYGIGVAADTGGAIRGARIDLWFPTEGQARAWGSRMITISVFRP